MTGKIPCRVIAAYGHYKVGDIIWPTGTFRDVLMAEKLIKPVDIGGEPNIERAVCEPERRRRGRPRKVKA